MINELANTLAREKDKFLFGLFKKHGYHRNKVMKLLQKGRISKMTISDTEIYCVDDTEIFRMRTVVKFDEENYKVTFYYTEVENDETEND